MATKMFFHAAAATRHRGDNTVKLNGVAAWWQPKLLDTSQGVSATSKATNTVTGATSGVEVSDTGPLPMEWITEPLSADFTISGTVTLNLRCAESNMSANVAINAAVDKIDGATGALTRILTTARTTEVTVTTETAENFTATPTSTACKRGDRLRVRVFGDDAGTMATGFTFTFWYDGATGATGDSWIQFNENLTFEATGVDPGTLQTIVDNQADTGTAVSIKGETGTTERSAQSFLAPIGTITAVYVSLKRVGSPADNIVFEIQTDSGSDTPSGTVVGTVSTTAGGIVDVIFSTFQWSGLSIAITTAGKYWLVARRSGANSGTDYYQWDGKSAGSYADGHNATRSSGTWTTGTAEDCLFYVQMRIPGSTYYLTDDAESINPGAAVEKKALTARGSGSVNSVTQSVAGPTAGAQITNTSGGTAIEWYTPPLAAITFGGKAKFNVRAKESGSFGNAGLLAEIAITAGDGSGATVWGLANNEAGSTQGELPLADTAVIAWVSGDDTAITVGQRLRFRIYLDDYAAGAQLTGELITVTYSGTSAAAAGDTYVILPVAVTEATDDVFPYVGGGYYP